MRILFMGTPDIAAASLAAILAAGHEVCCVYTREDKPIGRSHLPMPPPVKALALQHGLTIRQPKTLRDKAEYAAIAAFAPDLIVVVAYGRILPVEILALPRFGCINLHVSLLPRYRGAAPIQHAVLNGDTMTGVSVMYMDEGIDTGDIIAVAPVEIGENETSGDVFDKVSALGAVTLTETIAALGAGKVIRTPQDHSKATLAPPLTKEQSLFSFDAPAQELHNRIRGLYPWPGAHFMQDGKKIKVIMARKSLLCGTPGEVLLLNPLTIACATQALELREVVPEGKRPMQGSEWAAGRRLKKGDLLGS